MHYDFENEAEWYEVKSNKIHYNISKPYRKGTLTEWDSTVPENRNFGISFGILNDNTSFEMIEINRIGNLLSTDFKTNVFYHRTWVGIGKNKKRNLIFKYN